MLVGGCMEHIVGLEASEDILHTLLLTDGSDHSLCLDMRKLLGHHQTDVMLRRLGLVNQHHRSRLELSHLPHHL